MLFRNPTCASLIRMRLLVPLIAALVPLLVTPGALAYFDVTPRIAFLLFGTALILLYRAQNIRNVSAILGARVGESNIGRWWVALLAAQWLSSAIATAFSTHPALSLNGGNWRRFGLLSETGLLLFVLFAGAWAARDRRNIRTLLRAATAAGALAALYGIAQYFGWDPLLPVKAYQAGEGPFTIVRPPGTLGHADYFGAWIVIIAFFSLALERLEQTRWLKVAALITTALAVFAIVLSGTRSAMLGLLIGAIVFIITGRPPIRARAFRSESRRTDHNRPGCFCNRSERHSLGDARSPDRRDCLHHHGTSAHSCPCRRFLPGFAGCSLAVLFLSSGIEVESAPALVTRRLARGRAPTALAGFATDGSPSPHPGLRSGDLRH